LSFSFKTQQLSQLRTREPFAAQHLTKVVHLQTNSDVFAMEATAYYSSTSGTYFPDEASLKEHYQSDLHRYNLKRKVAGLPPVTKDWFDARKAQLTLSGGVAEVQKVRKRVTISGDLGLDPTTNE
jgi:hypothetical protein